MITWSVIGAVMLGYMHINAKASESVQASVPSQAREIDLSRWRHDGTQPMLWTKGNGDSFVDETVQKLDLIVS